MHAELPAAALLLLEPRQQLLLGHLLQGLHLQKGGAANQNQDQN